MPDWIDIELSSSGHYKGEQLPETGYEDNQSKPGSPGNDSTSSPQPIQSYLACTSLTPDHIKIKHDYIYYVCLDEQQRQSPDYSSLDPLDFSDVITLGNRIGRFLFFRTGCLISKKGEGHTEGKPYRETLEQWAIMLLRIISTTIFRYFNPLPDATLMGSMGLSKYLEVVDRVFIGIPGWQKGLNQMVAEHLRSIYRQFELSSLTEKIP